MKIVLTMIAILLIAAGCDKRECLTSHTEKYYDSTGTALWVATKNSGFIAQNGWKERDVCDEYASTTQAD